MCLLKGRLSLVLVPLDPPLLDQGPVPDTGSQSTGQLAMHSVAQNEAVGESLGNAN